MNRLVNEEEYRMSTEEREDILRRVMAVLVEEKHGKTVPSDDVLRIMNSYPNIKKILDDEISYPENNNKAQDEQLYPNTNKKAQEYESYSEQSYSYSKEETLEGYDKKIKERIEVILKKASAGRDSISYYQYEMALK